jgi:hypothetical protein
MNSVWTLFIRPCTLIISCSFTDIMFGLRFRLQPHGNTDSDLYTTVETVYLCFTETTCHESDHECCFKTSRFNGGPRKFFGIDGSVLHFTTSGPLSECPWKIPTCLLEMPYSYQPNFFFLSSTLQVYFSLININMDMALNMSCSQRNCIPKPFFHVLLTLDSIPGDKKHVKNLDTSHSQQ